MKERIKVRSLVVALVVLVGALWRIVMAKSDLPLANFSPIGAMALFGGCYFLQKGKAFIVPLFALLFSDLIIMNLIYPEYSSGILYSGWYTTYGIFALIVLIGTLIKQVNLFTVLGGTLGAAVLHFIMSNFAVWFGGGIDITTNLPYTKDISGLVKCYSLAIPFFKSVFVSNVLFSGLFFGAFELGKTQFPVLRKNYSI